MMSRTYCRFFKRGVCTRGDMCAALHEIPPGQVRRRGSLVLVRLENAVCMLDEGVIEKYNEVSDKKPKNASQMRLGDVRDFFRKSESELIDEIMSAEGFFLGLSPVPGAVRALNEMRAAGLDVRICCKPGPRPMEQIEWVTRQMMSGDWESRVVLSSDLTMVRGDILIDPHPAPHCTERRIGLPPVWEHVVFDKPYNRHLADSLVRIGSWSEWKISLGLDELATRRDAIMGSEYAEIQSFRHGSADSRDLDTLYLFSYIPSNREAHEFCRGTGDEDRNIIVVRGGVVAYAHKGATSECNNAFFATYPNHIQHWPNPVARKVGRNICVKYVSVVRKILALYFRKHPTAIETRGERKSADFNRRKNQFAELNFLHCTEWNVAHDFKFVATQLAMLQGLIHGKECYTKSQLIENCPGVEPFIRRNETACRKSEVVQRLNDLKENIVRLAEKVISVQYYDVVMLTLWSPPAHTHLEYQAGGVIVDLYTEECLFYGLCNFEGVMEEEFKEADWPHLQPHSYALFETAVRRRLGDVVVGGDRESVLGVFRLDKTKRRKEEYVLTSANGRFLPKLEAGPLLSSVNAHLLDFERYSHVFIRVRIPPARTPESEEVMITGEIGERETLVLVALRSNYSWQLSFDEDQLREYSRSHGNIAHLYDY